MSRKELAKMHNKKFHSTIYELAKLPFHSATLYGNLCSLQIAGDSDVMQGRTYDSEIVTNGRH